MSEASKGRLLVVDDEVKVAALLRQALEEEGYAVDVAHDGEAALQRARSLDYDLIVLDWLLPRQDGRAVCAALRQEGRQTPIVMLTAKDALDDRIHGLDSGADDYLTKPFALGELMARVRALLRRGAATTPVTLKVADLTLDPMSRHVTRGQDVIDLSAREYALLEYLMRNCGQTLSRTLIAEHVWDLHFDSGTNVVDVYINYLRNKIDKHHPRKLIHTVRGVGYRLDTQDA